MWTQALNVTCASYGINNEENIKDLSNNTNDATKYSFFHK
jgi:hypothetical protein